MSFIIKVKVKFLIVLDIRIALRIYQNKTNKNYGAIQNNQVKMIILNQKMLLYTPISRLLQKMEVIITIQMESK